jgi:glutaminyl-peptide cyclotransferase
MPLVYAPLVGDTSERAVLRPMRRDDHVPSNPFREGDVSKRPAVATIRGMDTQKSKPARPRKRRTVIVAGSAVGGVLIVAVVLAVYTFCGAAPSKLQDIPFDGAKAYDYLKQLCAFGPRPSGSPAMDLQRKYLIEHFTSAGGKVEEQPFSSPDPRNRTPVPMVNLIVHWHPESKERVLLVAHYDTLPLPLRDPTNPRGKFVGANDNASGVAILMTLAHEMPKLKTRYGVDFLLVDGEEYVFTEGNSPNNPYFLGAEHFARQYVQDPPPYRYRWGVLLDMVGSSRLQIFEERNSMAWDDTQPLVEEIWGTAKRLGVKEFVAKKKHEIEDDHLALHNIGHIPTCDVIDFDYPPWHTRADTPQQCSALSLAKVGWVIREWLVTGEKK